MNIKDLSARKFMAVWFSIIYGIIMVILTIAFAKKLVAVETYLALLGTFALIVKEIANDYFDRSDRVTNGNGKPEVKPKEEK